MFAWREQAGESQVWQVEQRHDPPPPPGREVMVVEEWEAFACSEEGGGGGGKILSFFKRFHFQIKKKMGTLYKYGGGGREQSKQWW